MARRGKAKTKAKASAKTAAGRTAARAPRDGSNLCLECGLCCDGTLFSNITVVADERAYVESLGLQVAEDPVVGLAAPQPCSAFVDGCCALYQVGRPATCGDYQCSIVRGFTGGTANLDDCLSVIRLVRSLAREAEVEMGLGVGRYTRGAVTEYLQEHEPWTEPERHGRFLVVFHRLDELGRKYFGYGTKPDEQKAADAGERLATGVGGP